MSMLAKQNAALDLATLEAELDRQDRTSGNFYGGDDLPSDQVVKIASLDPDVAPPAAPRDHAADLAAALALCARLQQQKADLTAELNRIQALPWYNFRRVAIPALTDQLNGITVSLAVAQTVVAQLQKSG